MNLKERIFWILAIFALFMSVAFADLQIRTSLTDSTAYLKKLILTNNGLTNGVKKIDIDGGNGDIVLGGNLIAVGKVEGAEICIAGTCKTYWPGIQWEESSGNVYRTSGNVGIGTDAPAKALDVVGDIRASGGLTIGGTITLPDGSITSDFILNNTVSSSDIKDDDITTDDIKNATITWRDINPNTIINANISPTANIDGTKILSNFGSQNLIVNGNSLFVDYASGSVGIGTSLPASELDVRGTVRAEEICDEGGNNCVDISTGWASNNYSLDSDDGTYTGMVYVNASGNVRISDNTENPSLGGWGLRINKDTVIEDHYLSFRYDDMHQWKLGDSGDGFGIRQTYSDDHTLVSTIKFLISDSGDVGIGTNTPTQKLEVVGAIKSQDYGIAGTPNLIIGDDAYITDIDHANFLGVYGLQDSSVGGIALGGENSFIYGDGTNIGIGTTSPLVELDLVGTMQLTNLAGGSSWMITPQTSGTLDFMNVSGGTNLSLLENGDVGIGTTAPIAKLDVNGDIQISGSGNGLVFPDGTKQTTASTSGILWSHNGSSIYSANSPTAWTSLDLSSYVGTAHSLLMLKIYNNSGDVIDYYFRGVGETKNVAGSTVAGGASASRSAAYTIAYIMIETDNSGVVEWKANLARNTEITLVGYIK